MANIAIDARPLVNPVDGIARYTFEIVTRLIQHQEHTWFLYAHAPLRKAFDEATIRIGPRYPSSSLLASQLFFPRWTKEDAIDVFWSPRHHLPTLLKIPSVVTIHDLCWQLAPKTMPGLRRLAESALTPAAIRNANAVTAVSQATRHDVLTSFSIPEHKVNVIGPGVQNFDFTPPGPPGVPYILSVGTIEPRKNHTLLVQSFSKIRNKVPHNLVIMGRQGWGGVDIDNIVESEGLQDRVTWIKDPSDEQLARYYRGAELYISCSSYEGFNLPILEAMSCGTPVLVSDLPVHHEVAGDCAKYFRLETTAIANSLLTTLSDRATLDILASNCAAKSAQYDWDKSAEKMLAVLLSALN